MQTLYIMQGVPGSGKSTVAKAIKGDYNPRIVICSTDEYFYEGGVYKFDPSKLGEYHLKNLWRAIDFMEKGFSVIVDNTNIRAKDCKNYVAHALRLGMSVQFIRVTGNFQSIHGVPQATIDRMKASMEDLSIEKFQEKSND